jgi:outer membrane protein OmpA-like peptidoglycan-associated protein
MLRARLDMRRTLVVAAALVALVALYAALGYWVAPGYVRQALADLAADRGLVLDLAVVRTDPFALRVELEQVGLRGPKGAVFARAERATADLAWASLWRRGWIVQHVHLASPQIEIGELPPLDSAAGEPPGEGAAPAAVTVQELTLEDGRLRHAAADVALEALKVTARDLSTLVAAAGTYEAAARFAGGAGQVASRGTLALAPLAAEGSLSVAALRASRLLPEAKGQLQGEARYAYADGELVLREVALSGSELAYAGVEFPQAMLRAKEVPIPPRAPVEVAAQASVAPHGKLAAQGRVRLAPLELHLNLNAESLPLVVAERWLPPHVALRIVSGTLSGTGLLDLAGGAAAYQGSAAIGELRLEERESGALLLAWDKAATESLSLDTQPFSLRAGEIALRAPEGRLQIEQDGRVNFARVLAGGEDDGGGALQVTVERLRIEQGTLHFADRSLSNPFEVTIRELAGGVTGFSTVAGEPARVRLNGRVQPYGVARIRGTIDLNAPTNLADITATLRNLRLEAFNPYIAKFAGYRIASGRLSATLRYEVRDGRLVGTNQLAFENMQLGEKLEQKGLVDLPLELAVALLADSQGRINLDIPVRGSLSDPQFDFGAIVAEALGNVVRKIVSAPFRALARLFGGGAEAGDPGQVAFTPGSARLSPPAEESVARLAEGLGERPQLAVEVHGGLDPVRDVEALRLRAARRDVARAAGVDAAPEMSNPKVVAAAERLYLQRGGERAVLQRLRESKEPYGRALLAHLAAGTSIDPVETQALARERAEAVRLALIDHGVDPARISVGETRESPAAEQGVPTALALRAAEFAAAGRTAPAPAADPRAPAADPVREAQRRLNAGGFDAGPVDGIFGPKTKRAVIIYQAVNGLPLTGELDAATRARLLPAPSGSASS